MKSVSLHFIHAKGESGATTNKEDTEKVPDVTEEDLKITVTKVRVLELGNHGGLRVRTGWCEWCE